MWLAWWWWSGGLCDGGNQAAEWLFNAGVAAGEMVQNFRDGMATLVAIGSDVYSAVAWIFEGKADNIDWWGDITDGLVQLGIVSQETGDKLAEWLFNAGVAAGEMVQSIKTSVADVWQGRLGIGD